MGYPLECNVGHEYFETLGFHNQAMCQERKVEFDGHREMERAHLYKSIQPYAAQ